MGDAAQILVIILSVFLAIFLLLAIVLAVLLIKVTKQIKAVTSSAKSTVDLANRFMANAGKAAAPAILSKYVMQTVAGFFAKKKGKK